MPVPPIYQPEVPARFIVDTALDGRRDKIIGSWNKLLVGAAKLAPGFGDHYAAIGAWESQLTDRSVHPIGPSTCTDAADRDADRGAHGSFDEKAGGFLDPASCDPSLDGRDVRPGDGEYGSRQATGAANSSTHHPAGRAELTRREATSGEPLMVLLLVFASLLLVAVLISSFAHRTIISTAALFLVGGVVLGQRSLGVLDVDTGDPLVAELAEFALFSVLFTDGMRIGLPELRTAWRLPGRALVFGMPLTFAITAVLAHVFADLPWLESFLLAAALGPTDPVFAAAVVGREEIPYRLRNLLNVESGLNDGLALPVVVVLLAAAASTPIDWACIHANVFLAGFVASVTVATMTPAIRDAFERFGSLLAELLKLAALLVFGALISVSFLDDIGLGGYVFALLALVVARPTAIGIALLRTRLDRRERMAAAWFGPKEFATVVYAPLILEAGLSLSDELFHLAGLVVVVSILAHSSTDVPVARWFTEERLAVDQAAGD